MNTNTNANFEYLKYMSSASDKNAILSELMDTYGNDVWNYALTLVRRPEVADDITQDVFLKAYRNLFSFRGDASVKTWLLTITRNTAYDYKRSAFFRKVTLMDTPFTFGSTRSAEHEVIERQAIRDVWDMVLKLPVKYREVLILFCHNQLSMKEIAEVLGIKEGTVKSRLHHARAKLLHFKEGSADENTEGQQQRI